MSLYVSPTPRGVLKTIGVCDRCNFKFNLIELRPDPDSPGLLVCSKCRDEKDPYKKPQRRAENIAVRRPRPDIALE